MTAVPDSSEEGSVAVMVAAPVATPVTRPEGETVAAAGVGRGPGDRSGEVFAGSVGVQAGGGEWLGVAGGHVGGRR